MCVRLGHDGGQWWWAIVAVWKDEEYAGYVSHVFALAFKRWIIGWRG